MTTIKIFIASSSELKTERMELVDLMQDMNDELEGRDIKLKPVLWEYMDSSMRAERKEDEYLEKLLQCEFCIVLFWRILGEYTEEELIIAVKEMLAGRLPRQVYVLFKEPCEGISKELAEFKNSFDAKYSAIPTCTFYDAKTLRETVKSIILASKP